MFLVRLMKRPVNTQNDFLRQIHQGKPEFLVTRFPCYIGARSYLQIIGRLCPEGKALKEVAEWGGRWELSFEETDHFSDPISPLK